MSTIRFEIRRGLDESRPAAIRMFYQISGERKAMKTGQEVYPANWNQDRQEAVFIRKGKMLQAEVEEINLELRGMEKRVRDIERRFELDGVAYDIDAVADAFLGGKTKASKASKELYSFIDDYIDNHSATRVKGSLSVYKSLKAHLQGYEKKNRVVVSMNKIDHRFFQAFQNYLTGLTVKRADGAVERALNNVTIAKQLSTLKTFLNYARLNGVEVPDTKFKIQRENDLEVIALNEKEYQQLRDINLSGRPAWDQVRDAFIFSCATGLRYSDLRQLRREHIKDDEIDLRAVKTGNKTRIPLSPDAIAILQKYQDRLTPLPVISNQKSNVALERICKFAGIDAPVEIVRKFGNERVAKVYPKYELIRMHCGRKTFATRMIALGMRAEIVMKIGGWKSWASFKRYMHLSDDTIKAEMKAVFSNNANLKIV